MYLSYTHIVTYFTRGISHIPRTYLVHVLVTFTFQLHPSKVLPSNAFWASRGSRCLAFVFITQRLKRSLCPSTSFDIFPTRAFAQNTTGHRQAPIIYIHRARCMTPMDTDIAQNSRKGAWPAWFQRTCKQPRDCLLYTSPSPRD